MAAPRPLEESILWLAEEIISSHVKATRPKHRDEARLQILEATAAKLGGFDYHWYGKGSQSVPKLDLDRVSSSLSTVLQALLVHPSLALASLARPEVSRNDRRTSGSYYTDFRLAQYLTEPLKQIKMGRLPLILDSASGTAILLAASVLNVAGNDQAMRDRLLAESICAADQSARAMRGATLVLASLTSSRDVITALRPRLRQADSLLGGTLLWSDVAPEGFDVCVGNPPWEKLKLSRHEFFASNGNGRHYGEQYHQTNTDGDLNKRRGVISGYSSELSQLYNLQGTGEYDLYKLFLELSVRLTRVGGHIMLLVPAGLIRSLGTKRLREFLLESCADISLTVLENRARFFAIDSRFKFVALQAQIANGHRRQPLRLIPAESSATGIYGRAAVKIARTTLYRTRPDLSVPEVRTDSEWKLFQSMAQNGIRFGSSDGPWKPAIMREVDMTLDRRNFKFEKERGAVPLVEGRMLHQHRHGVKRHVSGTGRRAIWEPVINGCAISPQFWFPLSACSQPARNRVALERVGFCDITGQTNERTMLAARIPSGVICGNKVPTILFDQDQRRTISDCWLAIANSISFDWLLRRVVTTTVNFFLLLDLPLPKLDPAGRSGSTLAELARMVGSCVHSAEKTRRATDPWGMAELRAEIEWRVLRAYGLGVSELKLMFEDFTLLDRSQPPIFGEPRSTITRDFTLLRTAQKLGGGKPLQVQEWRHRVKAARDAGAVPFIPTYLSSNP